MSVISDYRVLIYLQRSIFNMSEATLVTKLCKVLLRNIKCWQIGVITPYKAQERLIRRQLKDM